MKPFLNLDELSDYEEHEKGPYKSKYSIVSEKVGAKKLGYNVVVVPPGKKVCPFHNHRINEEMFLILEGTGTLRFGKKEYPIKKNDIIACPPGDQTVAHQILNTSNAELKYLCLSTKEPLEICEYPDSNKVSSVIGDYGKIEFNHISKLDQSVDYFDGEL